MLTLLQFKQRQNHNHAIMEQVTRLEQKALEKITDPDEFSEIIQKIDNLQKQYVKYE